MATDVEYQAEVRQILAEFHHADRDAARPTVTLSTLRFEKRSAILRLADQHGARNVRVFGSVVHGENGPDSDVDFLVDLDPGRTLFDLGGLLTDLRELLGVEVDLVEGGCIHPYIKDRVLAEAVPL
ncbi:MAG: nucleotidyltransferase family protein [bacterium]|nr:nucleotidyltransferase family protein [bacterium]